jgi:hypothetical protein
MAYHILHAIEHKLRTNGEHRSWETVRKILSTHQRVTIEYNEKTRTGIQRHHMRICTNAEVDHKVIYKALGMSYIPLRRKRYVVQNE